MFLVIIFSCEKGLLPGHFRIHGEFVKTTERLGHREKYRVTHKVQCSQLKRGNDEGRA